jgi:hypothetical protein
VLSPRAAQRSPRSVEHPEVLGSRPARDRYPQAALLQCGHNLIPWLINARAGGSP